MRSDLSEELAEFRREVKAVLDTALSETDAPLAVDDLGRGTGLSSRALPLGVARLGATTKNTNSCRVRTTTAEGNEMSAVDRELGLLEQSNAALFTALAQARAMSIQPLKPSVEARVYSLDKRKAEVERANMLRLREAAEIKERERRQRHDNRRLLERTRDLEHVVSDLERQKSELTQKMEEKRLRRERRAAEARRRKDQKRAEEERALRERMGYTTREADRLRAKLKNHVVRAARGRGREALLRWRACTAASVAARERRERLAAETTAATATHQASRAHQRELQLRLQRERERDDADRATAAAAAAAASALAESQRRDTKHQRAARAAAIELDRVQRYHMERYRMDHVVAEDAASSAAYASAMAVVAEQDRALRASAGARAVGRRLGAHRLDVDGGPYSVDNDGLWEAPETSMRQSRLESLATERKALLKRAEEAEAAAAAVEAAAAERRRADAEESHAREEERSTRAWRAEKAQHAKVFVRSLALIFRASRRSRDRRRVQEAFRVLREEGVAARVAWEAREVHAAREATARLAAVAAGTAALTKVLGRARRLAVERAFRVWEQMCREERQLRAMRKVAFRRVISRAQRTCMETKMRAFQRWRLGAAAVAMAVLVKRQRRERFERGCFLVEALLRRRARARLAAGFRHWRGVHAELVRVAAVADTLRRRRSSAVTAVATLLHRRRQALLRQGLEELVALGRREAEREGRELRARVLAVRKQRAARVLVLTRSWACWKAFAAASRSARRLGCAAEVTRKVEAERRRLRAVGLARACKAALAAADARRKAHAWRAWRSAQGLAKRDHAASHRVLRAGTRQWRTRCLRLGLRKWRERCEAGRAHHSPLQARASIPRSVAVFVETTGTPEPDVARSFRTWARAVSVGKVAFLKKKQAVRILHSILRASRRDALVRALDAWRSAASRRLRNGKRLQSVALRTAQRQRLFLLGKAWSKLVWSGGEREAARVQKLGAVRAIHVLLSSATRASRRRAWLKWGGVVVGVAAADRLHTARCAALRRCSRAQRLRATRTGWEILRARAQQARLHASGVSRLERMLMISRRRSLSHRLGVWRSEALAGAIASGEGQVIRENRQAAVRLLAATTARVERRRMAKGWRALIVYTGERRKAEMERALRSDRVLELSQRALETRRRRELGRTWKAWRELLAERRLRGAVGAATSSLEVERAALAAEVVVLKRRGAVRLMSAFLNRSTRALLQRGWNALRQATQRRATLLRATGIFSRSRAKLVRAALHRWRVATADVRAAQARAGAGRAVLAACLAGVRVRQMRPAWAAWSAYVVREKSEEDEFFDREEGLLRFASSLSRLGMRRDRARKQRALSVWRLGAARSAMVTARLEAAAGAEVARAAEGEKADLLAAQADCQHAGARLVLRWLHRRQVGQQIAAWRQWTAATSKERVAQERGEWRVRAAMQLAREIARVVDSRRHRIVRRALGLWRLHAQGLATHSMNAARHVGSREAGARRLGAVLERNLLRRKARVWARLVWSAVAATGRLEWEHEVRVQRERLAVAARSRSARRTISIAWFAWKDAWVQGRHRGEVETLRAQRGTAILASFTRRKELAVQRQALELWRARVGQVRKRERAVSRMATCLLRAEVCHQRALGVRCLVRWRLECAMHGKALAEEAKVSVEMAFRGQAIVAILRRRRLHRLGKGFRRLYHHKTLAAYVTKEEQARRDGLSRGLRGIRRMITRTTQKRVVRAFARWRCFAAEMGQNNDRALLLSARRRAGAQVLCALVSHRESCMLSRGWALWRSRAASAAVHDGERASADLRVSGARHSAGARLLLMTLSVVRRRALGKAWGVWCREARAAADAELKSMEKHFHLARTLTRVERRAQLARVSRAWRVWARQVRVAATLVRATRCVRRAQLAHGMARWRLACHRRKHSEADVGRASAESALRGHAIAALVRRHRVRQLREGFSRLFDHGAWAIYGAKEEAARLDRVARGLHVIVRTCARRRERRKLATLGHWQQFAAESRRQDDRALLQRAGRRAAAKALASLVSRRESASIARTWGIWRAGAATAAVHEGERASADQRVFGARRFAGARLVAGVLAGARRRALGQAWAVWCKEVKAAADAELQIMEKHFHLARTLTRVERRAQLARVGRAWRAWCELVRAEGEAELLALERHFHIAQVVARVVRRAQQRRLRTAWGLWSRLAARGRYRATGSTAVLPRGLLAATRNVQAPAHARAAAEGAVGTVAAATQRSRAERSRCVRHQAAAVAVRGLLRRADTRALAHSLQKWKGVTVSSAGREARVILGCTRLSIILADHEASCLYGRWRKWVAWSIAEGRRLEQAAEAESWAVAEAAERETKMALAAKALAAIVSRWETRVRRDHLRGWARAVGSDSPQRIVQVVGAAAALRRKLGGTPSPGSLSVAQPPVEPGRSPGASLRSPRISTIRLSPLRQRVDNGTRPSSPRLGGVYGTYTDDASPPAVEGRRQAWWSGGSNADSSVLSVSHSPSSITASPYRGSPLNSHRVSVEPDDHGSLDLSASTIGVDSVRLHSAGDSASPRLGVAAPAALATSAAMTSPLTNDSPGGSLAYTSESPLLGESVLKSRSDMGEADDGVLSDRSVAREWSWIDDDEHSVSAHTDSAPAGVAGGDDVVGTPERSRSRARVVSSSGGGGVDGGRTGSTRYREPQCGRSQPYVPGSIHESPSKRDRRWEEFDEDGEGAADSSESFVVEPSCDAGEERRESGTMDARSEGSSVDERSRAQVFLDKIRVVFWRRSFKRWVRVHRDALYDLRMMTATKKVTFLRRQQKLRKVVVSALRRQSYAWHVNDASRAMRKWKELVRRRREDDRLNLEISRISAATAFSPMTPRGARAHTAGRGLRSGSHGVSVVGGAGTNAVGVTSGGSYGEMMDEGNDGGTPSFDRSPFSPTVNSARRLWDKADD